MLTVFVLCSAGLETAHRGSLVLVAVLQAVTLATTYAVPNAQVHGAPVGLAFVLITALLLAVVIAQGRRLQPKITY